jgi:hypothetical protein
LLLLLCSGIVCALGSGSHYPPTNWPCANAPLYADWFGAHRTRADLATQAPSRAVFA